MQLYIAKTLQGLEEVLAKELIALGASHVTVQKRAVEFYGDTALMYAANIYLRTAIKILQPIHTFRAYNEQELYDGIMSFRWDDIMEPDESFVIDNTVFSTTFTHSNYAALKVKDAIVDQFRDKYNKRPDIDKENPTYRFNLRIKENDVIVSLDSSGESLHKRGYRTETHAAPMSEVQAAGLILLSGWDFRSTLYDPMCGSGTLPIEAYMIANNIAPGLIRKTFGFQSWKDYDASLFRQLMVQAAADVTRRNVSIVGSDIVSRNIVMAIKHAANADPENNISFFTRAFEEAVPPRDKGVVIINPPYGERLQPEDIIELYKMIGNVLKRNYPGFTAWVFSSNVEAAKFIGLKPSEKYKLKNGPLDCLFLRFDIREGKFFKNREEA